MQRLILLRHGKAETGSPTGADFDRVLTERGRRDSALTAEALAAAGFVPDLVLVSPAARAAQTWEAARAQFPKAAVEVLRALYNAEPDAILAEAERAGADAGTVMVVAHNPGLHQLAVTLAQRGKDGPDRARLYAGFPTAAAAAFDLPARRLRMFTPKVLGGGA
jgi:phosphohistidine phosphatase